jgi:nucleotide-binding universal stress UspA family protein
MTDHTGGYQHIVVVLDAGNESWAAFDEALRLARASKGRFDALVAVPDGDGHDLAGVAEQAASRAGTYPATMFVIAGEPAAAIVRHAEQQHCDLIARASRS